MRVTKTSYEVVDTLDATGTELFFRILKEVSGLKFVISHSNELKDRFKETIIVKRENGISFV